MLIRRNIVGLEQDTFPVFKKANSLLTIVFFPIWLISNFFLSAYQGCAQFKALLRRQYSEMCSDVIVCIVVTWSVVGLTLLLLHFEGPGLLLAFSALWMFYQLRVLEIGVVDHSAIMLEYEAELDLIKNNKNVINQDIINLNQQLVKKHDLNTDEQLMHHLAEAKWQLAQYEKKQEKMLGKIHEIKQRTQFAENENNQLIIQWILTGLSFLTALIAVLSMSFGADMFFIDVLVGCFLCVF